MTAPNLRTTIFEQFSQDFFKSKVKRLRKKLGWVQMGTKNCQLIQEPNSIKRLEFVLKCVEDGENFDNVNFTDECSVHMENHAKISIRRKLEPTKMKGHPKHPYKVHIWTGISKRGATNVFIFMGNTDVTFYIKEILEKTLLPFKLPFYPSLRMAIVSSRTMTQSTQAGWQRSLWKKKTSTGGRPLESPDLNLIELLWHELNHVLGMT